MNVMLKLFGREIFHFHLDGGGYPSVHAVEYVPVESFVPEGWESDEWEVEG